MRSPALAVAAGLAAIAAAVAVHLQGAGSATRDAGGIPVVDRGTVPSTAVQDTMPAIRDGSARHREHHVVPAGSRLQLSRLGVDAPVIAVRVIDGVMQIPRDPHTLGWWRGGAGPGDDAGTDLSK